MKRKTITKQNKQKNPLMTTIKYTFIEWLRNLRKIWRSLSVVNKTMAILFPLSICCSWILGASFGLNAHILRALDFFFSPATMLASILRFLGTTVFSIALIAVSTVYCFIFCLLVIYGVRKIFGYYILKERTGIL